LSKPQARKGLTTAVRIVFLVLLAFLAISLPGILIIVFVPVIGWYIWSLLDKNAELEKRIAALEKPRGRESDKP